MKKVQKCTWTVSQQNYEKKVEFVSEEQINSHTKMELSSQGFADVI